MALFLNEDKAVKAKFSGLTVIDSTAPLATPRPVTVTYTFPESELSETDYPRILLERTGATKADEREHRGPTTLPYIPESIDASVLMTKDENGNTVPWDVNDPDGFDVRLSPLKTLDYPIPYNLDYEVRVQCRNRQHLTQLTGELAQLERIPHRFGYIEVPEDGTIRPLDVLGGPEFESATDANGKRLFTAIYILRTIAEIDLYAAEQISKYVDALNMQVIRLSQPIAVDEEE